MPKAHETHCAQGQQHKGDDDATILCKRFFRKGSCKAKNCRFLHSARHHLSTIDRKVCVERHGIPLACPASAITSIESSSYSNRLRRSFGGMPRYVPKSTFSVDAGKVQHNSWAPDARSTRPMSAVSAN